MIKNEGVLQNMQGAFLLFGGKQYETEIGFY